MYVPDCPSLSPSQHIFTCRPYLMLFTKKVEIVSPLCELMTEIFWPKAMVSLLSSISLNVSQLPSVQNLKVCALAHPTLETSTCAETTIGKVEKNKSNRLDWKSLCLYVGVSLQLKLGFPLVWRAVEQKDVWNCQQFSQFVRAAWTFLPLESEFDYFRATLLFQLS